ncbi:hypothetical protein BDB00DRAFT_857566 [Zychaea mexicana]|uniref:uncharacterized protein n=1 Tax=Zychaea mexicana TaxID=64656 RepID=UPI0022FF219D|nr:uncharacterized protein BDB00DRAFT_857566 [Zychaea mexicana]KAI9482540.1 hypothetical protein BDB00DRAFT_857566 [Zychaea mexicana]
MSALTLCLPSHMSAASRPAFVLAFLLLSFCWCSKAIRSRFELRLGLPFVGRDFGCSSCLMSIKRSSLMACKWRRRVERCFWSGNRCNIVVIRVSSASI